MKHGAWAVLVLAACQSGPGPVAHLPESNEDSGALFGEPIDADLPMTELAAVVADPEGFDGRVIRTEGDIAQVCQRAGCWMELRDGPEGPAVRVPRAKSSNLPRSAQDDLQGGGVVTRLRVGVRTRWLLPNS